MLALTATTDVTQPAILPIVLALVGGSALLLYGLDLMGAALRAVAGDSLKHMLNRLTTNRFAGMGTGAVTTAILQSSTVTTVLVVGFVSAGLMSLSQAVGVIIGANIGSTVTAQIIAFKVTEYALGFVAVGYVLMMLGKKEKVKTYGRLLTGFGIMFLSLKVIGDGLSPLRTYQPFIDFMGDLESPLLGALVGAAFTALVHSSAVTTGIAIVLAGQGLLSLDAGIALALGANIGTCITAMIAAIGKTREAVRAALVHVIFNVVGVLLWIGFIDQLAALTVTMSPKSPDLAGLDRLAAETPRQIANAHTLFNVVNALIFIGFTGPLARLVTRLVPDRPISSAELAMRPKYLDNTALDTPLLALEQVRLETNRLGEMVSIMLDDSLMVVLDGDQEDIMALRNRDHWVDGLHDAIILFLRDLSERERSVADAATATRLMETANNLEHIGDLIETDLSTLAEKRLALGVQFSADTRKQLANLHAQIVETLRLAIYAAVEEVELAARQVDDRKPLINGDADALMVRIRQRLNANAPHRLETYKIETDIVERMKRVYYFTKHISRSVLDQTPATPPKAETPPASAPRVTGPDSLGPGEG